MAEIHNALESLRDVKLQHCPGRRIIDDEGIKLVAVLKTADLVGYYLDRGMITVKSRMTAQAL